MAEKLKDEITPQKRYATRKEFLKTMGVVGVSAAVLAACQDKPFVSGDEIPTPGTSLDTATDLADELTSHENVISYNNFYEFTTDKEGVVKLAKDFQTSPWEIQIGGLVENPGPLSMADIRERYTTEERIYRMRCVEGWSMVIPWQGFPLAMLLEDIKPKPEAKYIRFESIYDPKSFPGQANRYFPWPYVEGL